MASDPRDYKVDIAGVQAQGEIQKSTGQAYLSIHFACCGVYCRVYRNRAGDAYAGRCPRCGKSVRFPIGEGGTDQRYFVVE